MNEPMTMDALRQTCPAIFAEQPKFGVSAKYVFIPTNQLVEKIMERGWAPVVARVQVNKEHLITSTARHVVEFERPEMRDFAPDCRLRLMLGNSHDRTMRHWLYAGIFRKVCSNGLIAFTARIASMRTLHLHISMEQVLKTADDIAGSGNLLAGLVKDMSSKILAPEQQVAFATDILKARYSTYPPTVSPQKLLSSRRELDNGDDVWHVMNRVQENLIRGGVVDGKHVSKAISSVTEQLRLNRKIWEMAETYLN
jgi:hypothetical protein